MRHLPVADAFRAILRTTHPERTDLQQIDSIRWFHDRRRVMVGGELIHDHLDAPAYAAFDLLKAGVKSQKIRLRGMLKNALPDDIDPIDAREGDLDVFAGTLKIYESKATFRTARTYTSVHCYADDLPVPTQSVAQGPPSAPPKAIGSRTPPEQTRALAILQTLFRGIIPPELGFGDLLKRINNHFGTKARPIGKDTLRRALKSLKKRN